MMTLIFLSRSQSGLAIFSADQATLQRPWASPFSMAMMVSLVPR